MRKTDITLLEGQVLTDLLIHYVAPEINMVYLVLSGSVYKICGEKGSESLTMSMTSMNDLHEEKHLKRFEPFNRFLNKKIIETREIGHEWNGHGYELSFENYPEQTMIIQSIYTANQPAGFEDCIKLGVCHYYFSINE